MNASTDVRSWYAVYRKRGKRAIIAFRYAHTNAKAQGEAIRTLRSLSVSSRCRVENFVDHFIRGEEVQQLTSERDSDWINESERAGRCWDAAENGADGKTHSEVIDDWCHAFSSWLDGYNHYWQTSERFANAVQARFTITEMCQEIG